MKQLKIDFTTAGEILPSNYNSLLLSFIKAAVEKYAPQIFDEWFNKERNASTLQKSYTFSCFIPGARFEQNTLIAPDNFFSLWLSTYLLSDLMTLYNAFLGTLHLPYPAENNTITPQSLQLPLVPEIRSNRVVVKFDSALLVRSHDRQANRDRFLAFNDALFEETIRQSAASALERGRLDLRLDGFTIHPVKPRKTVISFFREMKVTANTGLFELQGDPALLNFLLLAGLGSATGSGHGKFHVIG